MDLELVQLETGKGADLPPSDAATVRKLLENAQIQGVREAVPQNRVQRLLSYVRNSRIYPLVVLQILVLGALVFLGFGVWHAVRAQKKLVDLATPPEPDEEARLLISFVQGGDPKQVEIRLRELVVRRPGYPDLRHHLATVLKAQGKMDEAREHWNAALSLNPEYTDARLGLGHLLLVMGAHEEAAEHFRKAVGVNPRFPDAYVGLAQALIRCGRPAEAEEALKKALAINSGFREARELLDRCRNST